MVAIGLLACAGGDEGPEIVVVDDDDGGSGGNNAGGNNSGGATSGGGGAGGDNCAMATQQCVGPDVYWFDCNGNQTSTVAQSCTDTEFCIGDGCVAPEYTGNWIITANPNMKTFLCGNATYTPSQVNMTVEASGAMTVVTTNFTPQITYTGQLNGKAALLTGSYDDAGGGTHSLMESWLFDSPDSFTGTETEHIIHPVLGDCGMLIWNLTGMRQ